MCWNGSQTGSEEREGAGWRDRVATLPLQRLLDNSVVFFFWKRQCQLFAYWKILLVWKYLQKINSMKNEDIMNTIKLHKNIHIKNIYDEITNIKVYIYIYTKKNAFFFALDKIGLIKCLIDCS